MRNGIILYESCYTQYGLLLIPTEEFQRKVNLDYPLISLYFHQPSLAFFTFSICFISTMSTFVCPLLHRVPRTSAVPITTCHFFV